MQDYTNHKDFVDTGEIFSRQLELLQHMACMINNNATKNESADVFNSNGIGDGMGQVLSQGLPLMMQFITKQDKEDMAQPITPIL
jgi:hypothetical protein